MFTEQISATRDRLVASGMPYEQADAIASGIGNCAAALNHRGPFSIDTDWPDLLPDQDVPPYQDDGGCSRGYSALTSCTPGAFHDDRNIVRGPWAGIFQGPVWLDQVIGLDVVIRNRLLLWDDSTDTYITVYDYSTGAGVGSGQWGKTSGTIGARTGDTTLGSGSVILSTGTAGTINQTGATVTAYNGSSGEIVDGKWVYVVKRATCEWDVILESCE
jgi:hypothetical protein